MSVLMISSVGYRHSGTYTCTASNKAGSVSLSADLRVNGTWWSEEHIRSLKSHLCFSHPAILSFLQNLPKLLHSHFRLISLMRGVMSKSCALWLKEMSRFKSLGTFMVQWYLQSLHWLLRCLGQEAAFLPSQMWDTGTLECMLARLKILLVQLLILLSWKSRVWRELGASQGIENREARRSPHLWFQFHNRTCFFIFFLQNHRRLHRFLSLRKLWMRAVISRFPALL